MIRSTLAPLRAMTLVFVAGVAQASVADARSSNQASTPIPPPASAATSPNEIVKVPGSVVDLELVPVSGKDGRPAFLVSRTEIPWDLYDVFVFQSDAEQGQSTPEADAVTRPSKPYISMDRGFGHAGFPAISISYKGATQFCEWLSVKTGRRFRLPTVAEWQVIREAAGIPADRILEHARVAENSGGTTHRPGSLAADRLGLVDLLGNAAEWCATEDEKGSLMGGSYLDAAEVVAAGAPVPFSRSWNRSDPQFPKSVWWLADGGFIGARVICDLPANPATNAPSNEAGDAGSRQD